MHIFYSFCVLLLLTQAAFSASTTGMTTASSTTAEPSTTGAHSTTAEPSTTGDHSTTGAFQTTGDYSTTGGFQTTGETNNTFSTTGVTPTGCNAVYSCAECVQSVNCLWCETSNTCVDGEWFGVQKITCEDWRWKQCALNGKIVLITVLSAAGFFILCFSVCICLCCCCRSKKTRTQQLKDFKEFKEMQKEEEKESLISKHPKTDARRSELLKKYGNKLSSTQNTV